MIRSLIKQLVFLLLPIAAIAQLPDYHLQIFDYSIGLRPGNYVSLARDTRGFVWILYPRSIQRFDGKRIMEFPLKGFFQHLHADSLGRIWASASDKVVRYADDTRGFVQVPVALSDSTHALGPVFSLDSGRVCLYSAEGLHALDTKEPRFGKAIRLQNDQPVGATDLFGTYGKSIFFRSGRYVYVHNLGNGQVMKLPNKNGFRLFPLSEHEILLSTWENETYRYTFDKDTITSLALPKNYQPTSGKTLSIRSIAEYQPGQFMIAAREGFYHYEPDGNRFRGIQLFRDGYPIIANDYCQQIHLDSERNVWLLTIAGLARFPLSQEALGLLRIPQPANQPQGSVNNVRQITEDREGNLWMATGNGFVQWRKKDGQWIHYSAESGATDRLAHPSIRGIAYDGRNIILGPTNFGAWIFHPGRGTFQRPTYKADSVRTYSERDFFDDITPLRNGNFLLLGRDALYVMEGKNYRLSILDVPASRSNTNRAFERTDGLVWVATLKGLHLLDSSLHHLAHEMPEGKDPSVWTGFLRRNGNILFPAAEGLYEGSWDGRRIQIRKVSALFEGSFLNSVYEDDHGMIWASSEKGLYRFNPDTRELNLFDYSDNIQGYGFNGNGPFRSAEGIVFWGGQNGMNYMRPENFEPAASRLRVFIQNVRIGEKDSLLSDLAEEAELPYENRSLEVELLAPFYNNPDKVKYRYRIDGLDEEWKQLGNNNRLRLTSLPSGRYQLQVQATVDNVNWTPAAQSFSFRVTEPFWLRTWFLALMAALVAVVAWAFIENQNRKQARKQEAERLLMETRQKIADAEMQALRAQMNPHFIFNCLNSINRYIVKSDQATASRYLTRFAKLIRLILDNSNSSTVSLSNELEALKLYVEMESIRFDKQFTWEISVDEGVQPDSIHLPPLIIQPYVENAIWHGLLHKETAGHLRVHVCCGTDRLLEVIIEDNGVGREAARTLRSKTASGNKSLGMKLTEERLGLLNRKMELHATVEVEDLYLPDGSSRGTRVSLRIPLEQE